MKTYLITGGAGFIGSTLADALLKDNQQVIVVDDFNDYYDITLKEKNIAHNLNNPHYTLYRLDIVNYCDLEKVFADNKIDCIIHLAARAGVRPSISDPILYERVNGHGTLNIFDLARKYQILNLICASSSSVYGNNKKVPFAETDVVDYAISPYAATKKANEVMGHVYHALYKLNIIFLRFFSVYGPRQRPDLAINKFVTLITNNEPIELFGDGSNARDYTYIDDIIMGIRQSVKYLETHNNTYEIINLGSHSPMTLKTMVEIIENVLGKKAIIDYQDKKPGDVEQTYADITKAQNLLNYSPSISFEEGIRKFVAWKQKGEAK